MMDRQTIFVADDPGPPLRRMRIFGDPPRRLDDPPHVDSAWWFFVSELDAQGNEKPLWDCVDDTFEQIKLYPPQYARASLTWRIEGSEEIVDLAALSDQDFSPARV